MKLSLAATCLFTLLVTAPCHAITLKLDPEIELLVLDGRKISGSLLKGADSLELERGEHQFLFRVEKVRENQQRPTPDYRSVPLIVTFTAEAKSIRIRLPALENRRERLHFDREFAFQVVDGDGKEIRSKRDRLYNDLQGDYERAMERYNRTGKIASVPRFAKNITAAPDTRLAADLDWAQSSELASLQMWFHRLDEATRQRFLAWVKTLRTS
ncbi:DUF2057 family protein [[Erwinia] mediterraneensis]|uniref:DUF2057 family protein n=1 Tax=[Erwinia] mediterraneensis TaxID=2161819 RepID=UPI001032256A|nr:DUF2057 family protein [[Erwinia] mediterraneensis]